MQAYIGGGRPTVRTISRSERQAWNEIGNFHFRRNEHHDAIRAYENARACRAGCQLPGGSDHIAVAYGNIGIVCWSTGDLARSITSLHKALELRMESQLLRGRDPETSLRVASSFYQLGLALSLNKEYSMALKALKRALEIETRVFGKEHVRFSATRNKMTWIRLVKSTSA